MTAPQYPAGPYQADERDDPERRRAHVVEIERAPARLRGAVSDLSAAHLDTRYRNWTIRQIVHHTADSHMNAYVRFKWALTEERPTIKAYDETRWSALADARTGDVAASLALLDGLHARWTLLLRSLSDEQYGLAYLHPESGETIPLFRAAGYYAWHGRHHTGQIMWLREQHGWR